MALNITGTSPTKIAKQASAILIQNNKTTTGTITIAAAGSTQYGTAASTIAIITDPPVGTSYRYGGLTGAGEITITASATGDFTVTVLSRVR